ncbi:MAG: hypothetical protein KatS3mg077_3044 [Candidatus Binatia bacterium]|nr:MAG: hypothetical protein KatS3mg077_3044 [Candidatus Binatia bacterium]
MSNQTSSATKSPAIGSWLVLLVLLGTVVAVVWYVRSAPPDHRELVSEGSEGELGGPAGSRAEQRLRELRAAHEASRGGVNPGESQRSGAGIDGGQFQVRSQGAGSAGVKVKPKLGASAAGSESAASADAGGYDEPDPDDIPALKKMALEDPDPDRRLAAVTLLGASDDPQAIPILAEALKDQDEEVRLAAIQSLADMTGDVPVEVLGNAALNDPSPDNRYEALEALADLAGGAARPYLERALHDPDEDVASLAESLLELEGDNEETQTSPGTGMAGEPQP